MFRIYRFFATASAIVVVAAMVLVGFFYHHNAVDALVKVAQDNNITLARMFSKIVFARFSEYIAAVPGMSAEELRNRPETRELTDLLRPLTEGLSVLKVKIYTRDALTFYSSELAQIGQIHDDVEVLGDAAERGEAASKLSYRDRFSAFSGEVFKRDVVETYVPLRDEASGIVGVFEIYSDVTRIKDRIDQSVISMVIVLVAVCALLYALLVLVVMRRAIAPLHRISERAQAITARTAGLRLPTVGMPRELQPLIEAMNEALDRLDRALDAQRQFSGDAAHELLTPLAVLTAHLDTLEDRETAAAIRQDVDRMSAVVQQLLEMAEFDNLELQGGEEVDLYELCLEVTAMLAPVAIEEERSVALTGVEGPVRIRGCTRALTRALRNLVENAIRFTPPGGEVEVNLNADGTIRVIDQGPGVPEDRREIIFRRFWRGDDKNHKGAGLGLSIVKRIVDAHDGQVHVEDAEGGGAVLVMSFPLFEAKAAKGVHR